MSSEDKVYSIGFIALLLATIALCIVGKSCNESDNKLKSEVLSKGCSYIGNGVFICNGEFKK